MRMCMILLSSVDVMKIQYIAFVETDQASKGRVDLSLKSIIYRRFQHEFDTELAFEASIDG